MKQQIKNQLVSVNNAIKDAAIIQTWPGASREQEQAIYRVIDSLLDTKNLLTAMIDKIEKAAKNEKKKEPHESTRNITE